MNGTGTTEVAGFGIPDAEATLEKEASRAWPGIRLDVREVRRPAGEPRIVESFELGFRLTMEVEMEAPDEASARKAARARARKALKGTRLEKVRFDS